MISAFSIITSDPKVKAILVNIFGGIVNCATIANGLVGAFERVHLQVPLIVRLEGFWELSLDSVAFLHSYLILPVFCF